MTVRDASRIRIKMPNVDSDGDGSAGNNTNTAYICVLGNVRWSGFKRQSTKTTCTESPVDTWGNIIHTYRAGRFIEMGTLSIDVDFDPDTASLVNAAFRMQPNGNYIVEFPKEVGESVGPKITIPAHGLEFNIMTDALAEGDNARSRATLVLKLAGDWTITNKVAA